MTAKIASKIRFTAKLLRPAATGKGGFWTFLTVPKHASGKLPSRGMTTVDGTINGVVFRSTLEMHIFVGSRATWDHIGGSAPQLDGHAIGALSPEQGGR